MRRGVERGQTARSLSLPAPVGGWNARDALDAMPVEDAIILENWFPEADRVTVRPGFVPHAAGLASGAVETLAPWFGAGGSKLIAAAGGTVFDVTDEGAPVVLSAEDAYASDRWQTAQFKGRLFACNGADPPWDFDGSELNESGWSGSALDASRLAAPALFQSRLFFVEEDSASFWYAGISAVTGTLTEFDLSQVANRGGRLQAIGTWSRDGGDGLDDLAVFVMSTGEIIVYQGTDPGDAAAWAKVGTYQAAEPIGRRCLTRIGGDLAVLTRAGHLPVSLIMQGWSIDRIHRETSWGKIAPAVRDAAALYGDNWGWQASDLLPTGKVYFNVPQGGGTAAQHVLNTHTGAWARATGLDARCWAVFGGASYFGAADGTVFRHAGRNDAGRPITADCKTAFSYLGGRGLRKRMVAVRPVLSSEGHLEDVEIGLDVDYSQRRSALRPVALSNVGTTTWGARWGSPWGDRLKPTRARVSVAGTGYTTALRIKVAASRQSVSWYATDFIAQIEGVG